MLEVADDAANDAFDYEAYEQAKLSLQGRVRQALHRFNPPARLWYLSSVAFRRGWHPIAWGVKAFNFLVFKAILPYECEIENDITLTHYGVGVALSPRVKIGHNVQINHHVAIVAHNSRIVIEDDVVIGTHAVIVGNESRDVLRIGKGARIGAAALVARRVEPGGVVVALPSRTVKVQRSGDASDMLG